MLHSGTLQGILPLPSDFQDDASDTLPILIPSNASISASEFAQFCAWIYHV